MKKMYVNALILCAFSLPIASFEASADNDSSNKTYSGIVSSIQSEKSVYSCSLDEEQTDGSFSEDEENEENNVNDLTIFSNLLNKLTSLEIPVVNITTVNGEEPYYEIAEAPEGCWGKGIKNATKVPSSLQIILNGETIYDSGEYVKKESGLTIKVRGNTSAYKDKKSYKLKLQKKADLLCRNDKKYKDKDWVLLRTGSCLNTPIGFWLSELIGQKWTPSHQYVNLCMNGEYRGLYILCEQISVNSDCRIDVDETDGYVIEADAYWWNEDISFPSDIAHKALHFTYKYPDSEDITDEWHEAIQADVMKDEATILNGTFDDSYDCESFAKWLLAWDILGNSDSGGANIYLVKKDSSSKVEMGPLWDFDHAFKPADEWAGIHNNYFYFHHMLKSENQSFSNAYLKEWKENGAEVIEGIISRINAFAESQEGLDYDESLRLERDYAVTKEESHAENFGDLDYMKKYTTDWFLNRQEWINNAILKDFTTAVDNIYDDSSVNDITYDILGRVIDPSTPGMQIRNGKKIFIR